MAERFHVFAFSGSQRLGEEAYLELYVVTEIDFGDREKEHGYLRSNLLVRGMVVVSYRRIRSESP